MHSFPWKIIPLGKQLEIPISILPTCGDLKTKLTQDQKYTSSSCVTAERQAYCAHIRTISRGLLKSFTVSLVSSIGRKDMEGHS